MQNIAETIERRTATDLVFERLFDSIASLQMLPGTKLSEVEVAKQFGVSRQPVREAFNRLEAQGLLLIRPQRATRVRGFSMDQIAHARFIRLAVEMEVVRSACTNWQPMQMEKLELCLDDQRTAVENSWTEEFHRLDYGFHKLICWLAGQEMAFETIQHFKRKVDRLCVLSLGRQSEADTLLGDHQAIAAAVKNRDANKASDVIRLHMGRLDETIESIHQAHAEYFE